jgi:hypothetical protein
MFISLQAHAGSFDRGFARLSRSKILAQDDNVGEPRRTGAPKFFSIAKHALEKSES